MHSSLTPTSVSTKVKAILTTVMLVLFTATIAGLIILWPSSDALPEKMPFVSANAKDVTGTVVETVTGTDTVEESVLIKVDDTDELVSVTPTPEFPAEDFQIGDKIRAIGLETQTESGQVTTRYLYLDHERGLPLLFLVILFVISVVAVARLKGVAALVGLVGALVVVWFFLIPALFAGENALLVSLVTASAVMFIVVYLAHGISIKTTTALLGTFIGIAVVATLAWWSIPSVKLVPTNDEILSQLTYLVPAIDPKGILLCGMVLSGVGVLNDVTITQSSAVWELRGAAPHESRAKIFAMAMRIGRDHIASTVYTVAFAYLGTSLALIMMGSMWDHTLTELLSFEVIASELVGILVCSIGLVWTIPLTTAIAAALCGRGNETQIKPPAKHTATTPDNE